MKHNKTIIQLIILSVFILFIGMACADNNKDDEKFVTCIVDPASEELGFYWRDDTGKIIRSIANLKAFVESKNLKLRFAVNGGMYDAERNPVGLFIQNSRVVTPLNTSDGKGNFYMKPNGVFYITKDNKAAVCKTEDLDISDNIKYATQSGPMLVIDGELHPQFKKGSENLNIRNGVGILPDGKAVFAMSKKEINFYDFALYFKSLGCMNALYLDGYVSRTYFPEENWIQTDGDFGVIIATTTRAK